MDRVVPAAETGCNIGPVRVPDNSAIAGVRDALDTEQRHFSWE